MTRPARLQLLPYQQAVVSDPARFTWNCWARQTGKSFTFSLRRLLRGLARKRNQIMLSAGERQSREVMEKLRQHCRSLGIWHEWRGYRYFRGTSFRQLEIRLPFGVRAIGLPANPLTARGYTGDVFLDEFAMHRDDAAVWASLFPTILRGDGELDVASTPRGRKNVFFRLGGNDTFRRSTVPLERAVEMGLQVDVEAMRSGIGDDWSWRQEFCCEFLDEATAFLTYELVRRCQDVQLDTAVDERALSRRGAAIYAGVDVGRRRDLTVIWLWEQSGGVFITRGVWTLSDAPFAEQEAAVAAVLQRRSVRRCCVDATGLGMQLAEGLTQRFGDHRVEAVTFTRALKSAMAGKLRVLAEADRLRIPPDADITHDWHSITRLATPDGHVRFDADRSAGGHADRFWAAALGLHAAEDDDGGELGLMTSGPLAFARRGIW